MAIKGMIDGITESGKVGQTTSKQKQLMELDAGLARRAQLQYERPESQMMMLGAEVANMLEAMANGANNLQNLPKGDVYQSLGKIFDEGQAVLYKMQQFRAAIEEIEQRGHTDGAVLARVYRSGGEKEVAEIYQNMRRFIDGK